MIVVVQYDGFRQISNQTKWIIATMAYTNGYKDLRLDHSFILFNVKLYIIGSVSSWVDAMLLPVGGVFL